ncbi:MAG: hypothetical protein AB7S36_22530 [Planctomycetota bacterium]
MTIFDPVNGTCSTIINGVVETGKFVVDGNLVSFKREFRWFRQP